MIEMEVDVEFQHREHGEQSTEGTEKSGKVRTGARQVTCEVWGKPLGGTNRALSRDFS